MLGLTWGDVDFENNVIRPTHQLTRATKDQPARRVALKTEAAERVVPILPALSKILREHYMASRDKSATAFVFVTETGEPLYYRNVLARGLTPALERAGLADRGFTFHGFRHSYATMMLVELGEDANTVATLLGHTNASFTRDTYVHAAKERAARLAAERLGQTPFGRGAAAGVVS